MDEAPETVEPANLKFLRVLVTTLTAVMIVGLITIVSLIVMRYRNPGPTLPAEITLPADTEARSVTFGPGWYLVVTKNNEILVFDRQSGRLMSTTPIAIEN